MASRTITFLIPSHDPGFSVKVATNLGLSSFRTPSLMLYSPTQEIIKAPSGKKLIKINENLMNVLKKSIQILQMCV